MKTFHPTSSLNVVLPLKIFFLKTGAYYFLRFRFSWIETKITQIESRLSSRYVFRLKLKLAVRIQNIKSCPRTL